jgi:IS30 family transposase
MTTPTPEPWVGALKVARPSRPLVADRAAEIRRLSDTGLSAPAVARRLGLCVSSVHRVLRASRALDDAAAGHGEPR